MKHSDSMILWFDKVFSIIQTDEINCSINNLYFSTFTLARLR